MFTFFLTKPYKVGAITIPKRRERNRGTERSRDRPEDVQLTGEGCPCSPEGGREERLRNEWSRTLSPEALMQNNQGLDEGDLGGVLGALSGRGPSQALPGDEQ